jgi:hypothetical protein
LELMALNVQKWGRFMPKLPSADFLHRLADVADRETLPRFRTDLAVDSKSGERYTSAGCWIRWMARVPSSAAFLSGAR